MVEPERCELTNVHEEVVERLLAAMPSDETLYDLAEPLRLQAVRSLVRVR